MSLNRILRTLKNSYNALSERTQTVAAHTVAGAASGLALGLTLDHLRSNGFKDKNCLAQLESAVQSSPSQETPKTNGYHPLVFASIEHTAIYLVAFLVSATAYCGCKIFMTAACALPLLNEKNEPQSTSSSLPLSLMGAAVGFTSGVFAKIPQQKQGKLLHGNGPSASEEGHKQHRKRGRHN